MPNIYNTEEYLKMGAAIKRDIERDQHSQLKQRMREGVAYYGYDHDILDFRLFYTDSEGVVREEKNRANIKIAHPFFAEQVDQKVQYLLSNPIEYKTDNEGLKEELKAYTNEQFQLVLENLVEGASIKRLEYLYYYYNNEGRLTFDVAKAEKVIEIYDENGQISNYIRYYSDEVEIEGKLETVSKAEVWRENDTVYFTQKKASEPFKLDESIKINPKPHWLVSDENGGLYGRGFNLLPFLKLENNGNKKTDLEPIKALIDDYDIMACALSNNLVDFDHPIYAVKGYPGDDLDTLVNNLKTKKTIGLEAADGAGLDVKTVEIPVNAREAKLRIDKEAIYKFGMAFDSSQVGDGNITNVVIKSRYSLLDLKCNKIESRLRSVLRKVLNLIVEDINQHTGKAYDANDIEIIINRDTTFNEKEMAEIEKIKEETKQVKIAYLLTVAHKLDDESVLKKLCETLELEFEEVKLAMLTQDYTTGGQIDEV